MTDPPAPDPVAPDPVEPAAPPADGADGGRRARPGTGDEAAPWPGPWRRSPRRPRHRRWSAAGPRPPWWPSEEPWPAGRRRRPWGGFGCLLGFVFLVGVVGLFAFATSVIGDVLGVPGPFGVFVRIAAVLVAIVLIGSVFRTGRTIRGSGTVLDALVDQAARVEAGDYTGRVEPTGREPAAVRELARGFNTMAARLEADEAQRRSLLADVTHELRTPLAVVQGNVEAILDGVHPPDEAHLAVILEETHVLARLVEDLRTLALSEAGSLSLHREPTDLAVLAGDVVASFAAAAASAGVDLASRVDDNLPLLDVDPVRIREVLANLVANALRHTPAAGRIEIDAARASTAGTVLLRVRDTGTGIDPALLLHVFDRFARGGGSTGSGLGLSIARGLVELHGGTIAAASAPGGGTEIRIELPIGPAG